MKFLFAGLGKQKAKNCDLEVMETNEVDCMIAQAYYLEVVSRLKITKEHKWNPEASQS